MDEWDAFESHPQALRG